MRRALAAAFLLLAVPAASDPVRVREEQPLSFVGVQATAQARVVGAVGIHKVQDLEFGDVRVEDAAGSVTVSPSGTASTRRATGGVQLATSPFGVAQFSVSRSGGGLARVAVTVPTRATLSRVGGPESVVAEDFVAVYDAACGSGPCDAPVQVAVGATVRVPASAVAGSYVGTFTVTVNAF